MARVTAASFTWGAAEASLFFVIPDVFVCYVALTAPRRAARAYLGAVCGALVGGSALWSVSRRRRADLERFFLRLPGIRAIDVETSRLAVERRGPAALIQLPLTGQPIKLYLYHLALRGSPLAEVLPFVLLNRLARLGASAAVSALAGRLVRRRIERHPRAAAMTYVALWSAGYAVYWRRRSG